MANAGGERWERKDRRPAGPFRTGAAAWIEEPVHFEPTRARFGFRTIWISDIHLGTRGLPGRAAAGFPEAIECETLYLVGDIVDGWQLRKRLVLAAGAQRRGPMLLRKARKGTRVVYVPGNHDEAFREYRRTELRRRRGRRRSDARDRRRPPAAGHPRRRVRRRRALCAKWLAFLGDMAYTAAAELNTLVNCGARAARAALLVAVASTSSTRSRAPSSSSAASRTRWPTRRASAASTAWSAATSTTPRCATIDGILYCNDGDWVESCTALVEHADGRHGDPRLGGAKCAAWQGRRRTCRGRR